MFGVYNLPTGNDMSLCAEAGSEIAEYFALRVISYSNPDSMFPIETSTCTIVCSLSSASNEGNWTFISLFEAISPLILNKKPQRTSKWTPQEK